MLTQINPFQLSFARIEAAITSDVQQTPELNDSLELEGTLLCVNLNGSTLP